jgi:capsular exopolysaccharide synthesis family protein
LGYVPRIDGLHAKSRNHAIERYQHMQGGPHSTAAEAYRALRTSLLYAAPEGNARAIVVTSPGMQEGKTTTVTNLGIALAQSGVKILLVDADLRKGRIHEVFHVERKPGLSEFLSGQASFDAVIKPTALGSLAVVTGGSTAPNPAELLGSNRMREFIAQATKKFDRVLLDTPPAMAVTDGIILAAMTETVVAVAQSGRTPRQALHRLVTMCHEVRAKLLGVVLNNVPRRDAPAYYRYSAYRYAPGSDNNRGPHRSG